MSRRSAPKVVAYAQGFEQIAAAAAAYGWEVELGGLATIWRGGCIIRARLLDRIREAYGRSRPGEPVVRRLLPGRESARPRMPGGGSWPPPSPWGVPTPASLPAGLL